MKKGDFLRLFFQTFIIFSLVFYLAQPVLAVSGTYQWQRIGQTKYVDDYFEVDKNGDFKMHVYLPGGQKISTLEKEEVYYPVADHLGSPTIITDEQAEIVETNDYGDYGDMVSRSSQINNDYWFTGQEYDEENGLQYYGARYYDNQTGRFTAIDLLLVELHNPDKLKEMSNGDDLEMVLFDPQRLNSYAYVLNNPVMYTDPNGLAELYIREGDGGLYGAYNANNFDPRHYDEWFGHTMVNVDGTYYGFNNLNNDRFDSDVQEMTQEKFEDAYGGQRWKVVDIGDEFDDKIVENFQKLKDASNQEYGTYRELTNNCTQKMWDVLAVSGVWDKNGMAPNFATTPSLFYEGLQWINRYENVRGFFDRSYDPLIKDMYTIKVPK